MGGSPRRDKKEIVIGAQCDRTGPTQIVGVSLCPAYHDYINLVNLRGGVEGYKIKARGDRQRVQGAAGDRGLREQKARRRGVDHALRHAADTGADQEAERGQDPRHLARLRHCRGRQRQALSLSVPDRGDLLVAGAAAIKFIKDKLGGSLAGKKIAYLYSTTIPPATSRW